MVNISDKKIIKEEEMENFAENFLGFLSQKNKEDGGATVVALVGDLGAGKTFFTRKVANHLGIKDSITSPTFVIQKSYSIPKNKYLKHKKLIHIDAYRLENKKELELLGWNEFLKDSSVIVFIEWPENVPGILPKNYFCINFGKSKEDSRCIDINLYE